MAQKIPKEIYVKKIDKVGGYDVWLMDGSYIRKEINENFVGFDEHYRFNFIPKNEFWIDIQSDPADRPFFIDHLMIERGFIDDGHTYKYAVKKANAYERRERAKAVSMTKLAGFKSDRKRLREKIRKYHLREYSADVDVWIVDGFLVRNFFLVDYFAGGHDLVYPFIPQNEVWIEHVLSPSEQKFIILHELHERYLMSQGELYHNAHKGATIVEDRYRDHPKGLDERIHEELAKNKS